jgi:hypothetical protein
VERVSSETEGCQDERRTERVREVVPRDLVPVAAFAAGAFLVAVFEAAFATGAFFAGAAFFVVAAFGFAAAFFTAIWEVHEYSAYVEGARTNLLLVVLGAGSLACGGRLLGREWLLARGGRRLLGSRSLLRHGGGRSLLRRSLLRSGLRRLDLLNGGGLVVLRTSAPISPRARTRRQPTTNLLGGARRLRGELDATRRALRLNEDAVVDARADRLVEAVERSARHVDVVLLGNELKCALAWG